jgi:site-specific recombinase XerD
MGQLRDRMAQDLVLRNLSPSTRRNYLLYCRKFAAFFRRSPAELGETEVRIFLLDCIEVQRLSYAAYRQIYAALKFLFTVTLKRPWHVDRIPCAKNRLRPLPIILHGDELQALFAAFDNPKFRALFMACYAAGLRIREACHLQVADIDSKRMLLRVRQAKGGRERYSLLSPRLLQVLRDYWRLQRPAVWLFPGAGAAEPVSTDFARQAFDRARRAACITKHCTPHTLRHCFATHLLDTGVDLVVLQKLLGHTSIRTTSRYTQVSTQRLQAVVSPLDLLPDPTARPADKKGGEPCANP